MKSLLETTVNQQPYRIAPDEGDEADRQIQSMLDNGVICIGHWALIKYIPVLITRKGMARWRDLTESSRRHSQLMSASNRMTGTTTLKRLHSPIEQVSSTLLETPLSTLFTAETRDCQRVPSPNRDVEMDAYRYGLALTERLRKAHRLARGVQARTDINRKRTYDATHQHVEFDIGSLVLVRDQTCKIGLSPKLSKDRIG